jgi:hypothetical protein
MKKNYKYGSIIALFLLNTSLNAVITKDMLKQNKTNSLLKLIAAESFKPGNKNNEITIKDAIGLYKDIIKINQNKEMVRLAHYSISELYFEIYYSDMSKGMYLSKAKRHFKAVLRLSEDISFTKFVINGKIINKEYPPKMVLDLFEYIPQIQLLYYTFYSKAIYHAEFKEDKEKANMYLNKMVNTPYVPSISYKVAEIEIGLLDVGYNFTKRSNFNLALESLKVFKILESEFHKTNILNKKYYSRAKYKVLRIDKKVTNKLKRLYKSSGMPMYSSMLKEWNKEKESLTFSSSSSKVSEKTMKWFNERTISYSKEQIKRNKEKWKEEADKIRIRRKEVLLKTGVDIFENDILHKMRNSNENKKQIFSEELLKRMK